MRLHPRKIYFLYVDDLRFKTEGWDKIILGYDNHFKDNIFRIRCSKYRNETYDDIWNVDTSQMHILFIYIVGLKL